MQNIKITRTNKTETILALKTTGDWNFDSGLILCTEGTRVMFSDMEVVLINPKTHLIFIAGANSTHQVETEYGFITLNVFTKSIIIDKNHIKISYLLENEENILEIERN